MELSLASLAKFHDEGFVVVPNVLDSLSIEKYLKRCREIIYGRHPESSRDSIVVDVAFSAPDVKKPEDLELSVWKILNPDRFDPVMRGLLYEQNIIDLTTCILGRDLFTFLLMVIYKPPWIQTSEHPFHQDGAYFPFAPLDLGLGVWMPLDPVDDSNGTLNVIPRSHKLPIRQHNYIAGKNPGCFEAEEIEELRKDSVFLNMQPGDAVFFHTRLLHRTGGNSTARHRRVVTLHVASARAKPTGNEVDDFRFHLASGRAYSECLQPHPETSQDLSMNSQ